ncbi:MAG: hypothetical protein M3M85_01705 [bacterium]|nr:hypothetical protein [bacterium]
MDNKDELQIKIEKARMGLPEDTRSAIDAVDWRGVIMQIRNKEGYDFIQLSELETETELLLCGLANPEEYPKHVEKGMGISREAAQKLVNEMNEKVFKKIKEELIKITETKKVAAESAVPRAPVAVAVDKTLEEGLGKAGIQITEARANGNAAAEATETREEILEKIEAPTPAPTPSTPSRASVPVETHPLLAEKLSGPMQIPSTKTVHSLDNLTKPPVPPATTPAKPTASAPQKYSEDPYREKPE